jgi:hypothetical protein
MAEKLHCNPHQFCSQLKHMEYSRNDLEVLCTNQQDVDR